MINTPRDTKVVIQREDFGRTISVYVYSETLDGREYTAHIAHVQPDGSLDFDTKYQEGTAWQNPTMRFVGVYAYEAARQFALAFAQAGFYEQPSGATISKQLEHADRHISTLVEVNSRQDYVTVRQLDIIEKLVEKRSPMDVVVVPHGTEFRKL